MAIKLKKNPPKKAKKKIIPHYWLTINYMIGDADGHTKEVAEISKDNPYLEKFCKLLKKLKSARGYGSVQFEEHMLKENYKSGRLTKANYEFMKRLMFNITDEEPKDDSPEAEQEYEYALEFEQLIRCETDYSYLSYEDYELTYVDENGKEYDTTF